jgi:hypothetical protein
VSIEDPPDYARLDAARRDLGLSVYDLWVAYIAAGGRRDAMALRSYLTGMIDLPSVDHDELALALNELYADAGGDHPLPYRRV